MKNVWKWTRLVVVYLLLVSMVTGILPAPAAMAAAGDVPAHDKTLTVNNDGTYTIALNVTGDSDKQVPKVNVIVIIDRSGSMGEDAGTGEETYTPTNRNGANLYGLVNGEYVELTYQTSGGGCGGGPTTYTYYANGQVYTGQRYELSQASETRMAATKRAVNSLGSTLLAYNEVDPENYPDVVQMAVVQFATGASTRLAPTTSASSFTNSVNGITVATGNQAGTNWEAALKQANTVNFGDTDPTFVIFFSDGSPTFYGSGSNPSGSGQEEEPNMRNSYNAATDDAAALAGKVGTDNFYTIFAYGTNVGANYMSSLTTAAGAPSSNNYSASSSAELQEAFGEILDKIETAGIASVQMQDGTTSSVTTTSGEVSNLLTVDTTSYKYYRAGGTTTGESGTSQETYDSSANNGLGEEWADAPAATFENGAVKWDLGTDFILENGVTYTVTFDCWPSQTTLDIVADIKNDPSSYNSLDTNIKKYIDSNGNLKTNTTATLSYTDTRTGQSGSTTFENPDPVSTTAVEQMAVAKEWKNKLDGQQAEPITLYVTRDGEARYNVEISDDTDWKGSVYISVGIIKGTKVLEKGHDFTFTEPDIDAYHWELNVPTVRPMIIDGTVTELIKVDATHPAQEGAKTYEIEGATYYVASTGAASLTAVNERRSSVNIIKAVEGEDVPEDAEFPFSIKVVNAFCPETEPTNDSDHNSDWWVWISVRDADKNPVTEGVTGATNNGGGWYYMHSGGTINIPAKAGYSIRLNNLPTGSTYTVTEGTLPTGFIFEDAALEVTAGEGTADSLAVDKDKQEASAEIDATNSLYVLTVNNKYELKDINVTKVWDDNSNQDGMRPETLELTLNGLPEGSTVPLPVITKEDKSTAYDPADNEWYYTWKGVPAADSTGKSIQYTVTEAAVPEGYECEEPTVEDEGTITNKHEPEVTTVTVKKSWQDEEDQDGIRPDSITVTLTADGETVQDVTLEGDEWSETIADLPVNKDGESIQYTVTEPELPEGYEVEGEIEVEETDEGYVITVTNKHETDSMQITVIKTWEDDSDQDGVRPEEIEVQLLADGEEAGDPVTLDEDGDWTYTWEGLPVNKDGSSIQYSVNEITVEKYESEVGDIAEVNGVWTIEITNTHVSDSTQVTVTKVWEDDSDQDGVRPDSIEVQLLADGTAEGEAVELTETDDWTYTWEGLPVNKEGKSIEYTVDEVTVDKYETEVGEPVEGDNGWEIEITNTHESESTQVQVIKTWEDDSDQDGMRPDSIEVQLLADGTAEGDPATLDEDGDWTYTWEGLPVNKEGKSIEYSVEELEVTGYTSLARVTPAEGDDPWIIEVTNTHTSKTTEIVVTKVWEDDSDQDGVRPDDITVTLTADGEATSKTVTLSDANDWTDGIKDLPVFQDGKTIEYSFEEPEIDGYESEVAVITEGDEETAWEVEITNTHESESTQIKVTKVWEDESDQAGIRPDSVSVQLLADGEEEGDPATLNDDNDWTYSWEGLPVNKEGKSIEYTLDELEVKGYAVDIGELTEGDDGWEVEITNTYNVKSVSVDPPVKKEITGNEELYNNGDFTFTIENTEAPEGVEAPMPTNTEITNTETYERTDKEGYYEFGEIVFTVPGTYVYTVTEEGTVPGVVNDEEETKELTFTVTFNEEEEALEVTPTTDEAVFEFTNEYIVTEITVEKVWEDDSNQDGVRPDSISVQLLADGEPEGDPAELNEENEWTYTFEDLPVYTEDRETIQYSIEEVEVDEYKTEMGELEETDTGYAITITNIHESESTQVTVTKAWEDDSNQDGLRVAPEVTLIGTYTVDGEEKTVDIEEATRTIELGKEEEGVIWEGLPVYQEGAEVTYTVTEASIDGYETQIEGPVDGEVGWYVRITNTHESATTQITVTKVWEDDTNQDGLRPATVSVQLLADGEPEGEPAELSEQTEWTYTWEELPVNKEGKSIEYSVEELEVEEYETEIGDLTEGDEEGTWTIEITNTHESKTTEITVVKIWDDNSDQDGVRKDAGAQVQLYKTLGDPVTPVEEEPMVRAAAAEEAEVSEAGEAKAAEGEAEAAENKAAEGEAEAAEVKAADDGTAGTEAAADEGDDEPVAVGDPVDVGTEEDWSYTWTDLPAYENGREIIYSVKETLASDEYTSDATEEAIEAELGGTVEITNTHETKSIDISVKKIWQDDNDRNSKRPEQITVRLMADGEEVESATLDARSQWSYTWEGLPEYKDGKEIAYSVKEDTVSGYKAPQYGGDKTSGFTVTNSLDEGYDFRFVFYKKWVGGKEAGIDWTFYYPDGAVYKKTFEPHKDRDPWMYEAWLPAEGDYYVIENVPAGYTVRYENVGAHAGETDRCYNGGTIVNISNGVPQTGDNSRLALWAFMALAGVAMMGGTVFFSRKRKEQN